MVVLDVAVTDKSGRPVSNLTRSDFTITEDKTPQMTADFERPDQHRYSITTEDSKPGERERSGRSVASAVTILVIDCLNTEFTDTAYAREMVTKYLRTHGPRLAQPTAIMMITDTQLELVHDYTEDAGALEEALTRQAAEFPVRHGSSQIVGDLDRLQDTLNSLEKIAAANMNFAGRKNVIWISQGFPSLNLSTTNGLNRTAEGPDADLRRRLTDAVTTTANEMWDARLAVYTIDPRGLKVQGSSAMDVPTEMKTLESIAPQTGGKIFLNRNDADVAMANIVEDGSDYYTLSYYPKNTEWDGKFRSIRVTLARTDLEARSRTGYYAKAEQPDTDTKINRELAEAVKNPLAYRGLGMTVSYKVLGGTPRQARYTIAADRHDLGWKSAPGGERRCSVRVVAMSVSGKERAAKNDTKALEGAVKNAKFDKEMGKPMLFTFTGDLPTDAAWVRVVVRDDKTGKIGSTDLNIVKAAGAKAR